MKPENLDWFHRKLLFEQVFNETDENGNLVLDFICLQEVDKHGEIFHNHPVYKGEVKMKDDGMMGCAIFYNSELYELIDMESVNFKDPETGKDQNQLYMFGTFRNKKWKHKIRVGTTHLKAKKGFEKVRAA